jgi:hypothetical protein
MLREAKVEGLRKLLDARALLVGAEGSGQIGLIQATKTTPWPVLPGFFIHRESSVILDSWV